MSTHLNAPKLLKTGPVLIVSESAKLLRTISRQHNPERLTLSLQVNAAGREGANRSGAMRFKGSVVESTRLETEMNTANQVVLRYQDGMTVEHDTGLPRTNLRHDTAFWSVST